jgi:hypothetical protein
VGNERPTVALVDAIKALAEKARRILVDANRGVGVQHEALHRVNAAGKLVATVVWRPFSDATLRVRRYGAGNGV